MAYPALPPLASNPTAQQLAAAMARAPDCASCPSDVVIVLQIYVYRSWVQVRTVKYYVAYFAGLSDAILADGISTLRAIVNAIPTPDALLNSLLGYLTCPLTPLALTALMAEASGDQTIWSPIGKSGEAIAQDIRMFFLQYGRDLKARWKGLLRNTPQWRLLRRVVEMLENVENLKLDAFRLAHATLICTTIESLCPDIYRGSIFQTFIEEATGFSMTEIVPSGLRGRVNDAARLISEAQTKLNLWAQAATGRTIPTFPVMP